MTDKSEKSQEEYIENEETEFEQLQGSDQVLVRDKQEVSDEEDRLSLEDELLAVRVQAEEYMDGWQRARAEFANYKKRVERERAQVYQNAKADVIKRYLDVIDDMQRALENRPEDGDGAVWAEGIDLIYRKLVSTIENEGVTRMETDGKVFDPNLHEAISLEKSPDHESGEIIDVVKQGYMIGDRVLRPASVRVAS